MKRRLILLTGVAILSAGISMTATAGMGGGPGKGTDFGDTPAAEAPAAVTFTIGALQQSISVTEPATLSTSSTAFVDLPGAGVTNTFGGSTMRAYHVTLSGTCAIDGTGTEEDVEVRALINGVEMSPGPTTLCEDFETDANAIPEWASAQQWVAENLSPGTYTITIQWRTSPAGTGFLRDYHLTVRRHKN